MVENFTKIERIRSYETVIQQFVHMITTGQIKPGSKLPTERELSEKLGITRPTLREAFRVMENLGFVESRMGSGRYLKSADARSFGLSEGQEHLALYLSFMEARAYIERGSVVLACARALDEDIAQIGKICRVDMDPANFIYWDTQFHLALAKASHNPILEWIMGSQLFTIYFSGASDQTGRWSQIKEEHQEIYTAIASRDSKRAEAAIVHHLKKIREKIIGPEAAGNTPQNSDWQ